MDNDRALAEGATWPTVAALADGMALRAAVHRAEVEHVEVGCRDHAHFLDNEVRIAPQLLQRIA